MSLITTLETLPVGDTPHAAIAVGLYVQAAIVCVLAARRSENRLWSRRGLGLAILMALALNRGLEWSAALMAQARAFAGDAGWYEQRRLLQNPVAVLIAVVMIGAVVEAHRRLRHRRPALRWAATGLVILVGVQLLRGLSLHHLERLLACSIAGLRAGWMLELTALAIIITAAGAVLRARAHAPRGTAIVQG